MKHLVAVSGCAVLVFLLPGCAGEGDAQASVDCLTVPAEVMDAIAEGAPAGSGFVVQRAAAVVGTGNEVHFVAMRFDANGETGMTGVWATTSIGAMDTSNVVSVDGFAKQFTGWPDAEQGFQITSAHPAAKEATGCLA